MGLIGYIIMAVVGGGLLTALRRGSYDLAGLAGLSLIAVSILLWR